MPVLEARNLSVVRDGATVVHDLSLRLESGRITALLGPNGSGKTSTMLGLLGLLPHGGAVTLDGQPINTAAQRRRIGFVPQEGGIPSGATAREWIELQARLRRADEPDLTRICDVLQVPTTRRLARRLSGGERRRVSLAAALVGTPDILILDEPTAGLDPELRAQAVSELQSAAHSGAAVLLSTHLLDEIVECADEILVLRRGTIIRAGTPAALFGDTGTWTPRAQSELLRSLFEES